MRLRTSFSVRKTRPETGDAHPLHTQSNPVSINEYSAVSDVRGLGKCRVYSSKCPAGGRRSVEEVKTPGGAPLRLRLGELLSPAVPRTGCRRASSARTAASSASRHEGWYRKRRWRESSARCPYSAQRAGEPALLCALRAAHCALTGAPCTHPWSYAASIQRYRSVFASNVRAPTA
jgi:hypothetical protein